MTRGSGRALLALVFGALGAAPLVALLACSRPAPSGGATGRPFSSWREPATGMEFVFIPAGRFRMGSEPDEPGRQADETPHEVEITHGFYLGKHEVTQAEWVRLMGSNSSRFPGCPRCPVETVSYDDVQVYIARLTRASAS